MPNGRSLKKLTLMFFLVAALTLVSCSHRTPYIRDAGSVETPPTSSLVSRIILVGDAGETNAPVLADVDSWAAEASC